MLWFIKACLKTHIAKAYWYYRREKRKSRTFPIVPSEVPRARPRAHLPASGEAGRAPSSTNSARALSLTPPPFSTKLSSSAAAEGATHTHSHTLTDCRLRYARAHPVDYHVVERRARWREETRRVLQRERLSREVRVAVSQSAHHAHFCSFQAFTGMINYHYIRQKLHQFQFQWEIHIKFYVCHNFDLESHNFDLVCNFLTFNLFTQSWNLDYCFSECFAECFYIFDRYVLFNGRYTVYAQTECTQNFFSQINHLLLIIILIVILHYLNWL